MFRIIKWLIALPASMFIFFNVYVYGNIITYHTVAPYRTTLISVRIEQFAQEGGDMPLDYRWVLYNQISLNLKKAPTILENARSTEYVESGWGSIQYAIKHNRKTGKVKTGDSTISQRFAKNPFLSESHSYIHKGEEAAITAMMEAVTDKDCIFELYLSSIEWHYGAFGAEAAIQKFFHKPAANPSRQQVASLTACVPVPLFYANNPKSKYLCAKTNIILRRIGSAELPDTE